MQNEISETKELIENAPAGGGSLLLKNQLKKLEKKLDESKEHQSMLFYSGLHLLYNLADLQVEKKKKLIKNKKN
jgi:hypothetical protein